METNVVLYIRVSTDEQKEKGFSLQAQEHKLRQFCKDRKWNVLEVFSEDYSAWKGFERPAYKKAKEYIIKHHKNIHHLLFTQWSRFSRDALHSYNEILALSKLKIEANAIEQWVDSSVPENKFLQAIYFIAPQIENDRLSLRTKAGMDEAVRQGRWLWKAPFGYSNDQLTKLIVPDPVKKDIVKKVFSLYASGSYSIEEVRKKVEEDGCDLSKQGFINLLTNPLYTGQIPVRDNKGKIVELHKAIHEPLVSHDIFDSVQAVLNGKRKPYQGKTKGNDLPLKGSLVCPNCGKTMTGSASKGNGGYYHYYHCQRKYGCKTAFKASVANSEFEGYLQQFQANNEAITLYSAILEDVFNVGDVEREQKRAFLEKGIENVKKQIAELDEKLMTDSLPLERYNRISEGLEEKQNDMILQHATLGKSKTEFASYIKYSVSLLSDISGYYSTASLTAKQKLIGSIFPEKIVFDGNKYRTDRINEVLAQLCSIDAGYKRKQPNNKVRLSSVAPPSGLEPETL